MRAPKALANLFFYMLIAEMYQIFKEKRINEVFLIILNNFIQ